LINTVKVIP